MNKQLLTLLLVTAALLAPASVSAACVTTNCTEGLSASAKDFNAGHSPDNLVDGSLTSDYYQQGNIEQEFWFTLYNASGGAFIADQTKIWGFPNGALEDFQILGSNDNNTWTVLETITGNTDEFPLINFTNSNAYQYYRFNVTSHTSGGRIAINETELFLRSTPAGPSNFTISALDEYTSGALTNFSAEIDGTNYTTTTGLITTDILSNSTSLYNITVSSDESGGYFNRTYTDYNVSSDLTAQLLQAKLRFEAYNRVTAVKVSDFTLTTNSNGGSATSYDIVSGMIIIPSIQLLNVTAAPGYEVEFVSSGYYKETYGTFEAFPKTTTRYNLTEVYDHRLNISISVGTGSATENNFTADIYSDDYDFHEQLSTTSGNIVANLTDGNYTVWLNDSVHELVSANVTLNSSVNLTQLVIDARTARTFDIEFRNETDNTLLDNQTILVSFISDSNSFNTTTSNGTVFEELLVPDEYEIQYRPASTEETVRSYFVTLNEQSYENLTLYLIDEDVSSFYVARVVDQSGSPCQEQTVSLLRYYIAPMEYRIVQMARTDSQGQTVFRVRPNTVDYKFLFSGDCGSFESSPSKLIDSINTYTVFEAQNYLEGTQAVEDATTGLLYVNSTRTFSYSWTSSSNVITEGCLEVTRRNNGVRTVLSDSCSTGMSGSVVYTIPANLTNQSTFFARGYLETNTDFSTVTTNNQEVSFLQGFFDQGDYAPFAALIIFIATVLLFGTSAPSLLVGTTLSVVLLSAFYFLNLSWATVATIIILAGVMLYRLRTA